MKKILLFLSFLLMSIGMWGATASVTIQASSDSWTSTGTSGTGGATSVTKTGITVSSTKGYKDGTNHIREYSGCVITVSSTVGTIQTIVFTSTANSTSNYGPAKISLKSGQSGTYSYSGKNGTWSYGNTTSNMTSVQFNATAQFRWTQVVVTYNQTGTTYSVTYNLNGGGGTTPTESNKEKNATFTLHNGTSNITAPSCKTFSKWRDQDNVLYNGSATYTMPAKNVTLTAQWADIPTYTISFNNAAGTDPTSITQSSCNTSITLPDTAQLSDACSAMGWLFAGWTVKSSGEISASDLVGSRFTPTKDTTLYAVYKKSSEGEGTSGYVLVEEDLDDWSGDYLIAYSSTIFADGRVGGTSGMGAQYTSVDPSTNLSGKVVDDDWGDQYNVTLETIEGGYVMKTKDGKYNYQTSNTNGLASTENLSTASAYPLSVTFNSSSDIDISISAGAIFHYNPDGYFRFYKNGSQNNIYLYKKQGSYDYSFSPVCETVHPDTVTFPTDTITLQVGDTLVLKPTVLPTTTTNKNVFWFSMNEDIATVTNGTVTGVAKGTTGIVVMTEDGNKMALCVVIVTSDPTIDIVEWNPDYIKLDVDYFEATTAIVENQNTKNNVENTIADGLFFSKYFEAAANIKLWAIYNGTKDTIPLTNVKVLVSSNGNAWDETNANKVTHLDTLGRIKKGYICPNEEIIVYNDGDNTGTDVTIMECINEKYDISNWYMISNNTTSFSGDDGLMLLSGSDTLDIIGIMEPDYFTVGSGQSAKNHSIGSINNPHGDDYGWCCENGKNINGDSTALSTNRCLLIRRNTVQSGANAVALNRTNFVTLCDEWVGEVVEKHEKNSPADAEQTCEDFAYVGDYDYGNYYAQYEPIDTIEFTNGLYDNETGIYTIYIPQLDTLSCTNLKVKLNDGNTIIEESFKIPIFVKDNISTTHETFTKEGDGCATCDVVVLADKILTVAGTASQNRDVKLYNGARLLVPTGTNYTINSLSLRRENNGISTIGLNGNLTLEHLYLDLFIDNKDWYYIALPDEFTLSNLKYTDGNPARYGYDYLLYCYDGNHRALTQKASWKMAPKDTTFQAGGGFIMSTSNAVKKREFRFEFNATRTLTNEKTNKTIDHIWSWGGGNDELAPNHKGWNLVGNPFLTTYETDITWPISIGKLVKDTLSGKWNGGWIVEDGSESRPQRYAVIPSKASEDVAAGGYKSVVLDEIDLQPFTCFFVQMGGETQQNNQLVFHTSERHKNIVARNTYNGKNEEVFLRLRVDKWKTGCFISNKFTDKYEPGDDLESRYPIYQKINGNKLLYSAINDSIIEQGVTIQSPKGHLILDPKVNTGLFEYIYVNYKNEWYNLLTEEGIDIESGTFILQAKIKRDKEIATGLNDIKPTNGIYKFSDGNHIYINRNNDIYSVFGSRVR